VVAFAAGDIARSCDVFAAGGEHNLAVDPSGPGRRSAGERTGAIRRRFAFDL
jgi:hypothetical protein